MPEGPARSPQPGGHLPRSAGADASAREHLQWMDVVDHVVARLASAAATARCLDDAGRPVSELVLPRSSEPDVVRSALRSLDGLELVAQRAAELGLGSNVIGSRLREVVDVRPLLERAEHGSVLDVDELCAVADTVGAGHELSNLFAAVDRSLLPNETEARGSFEALRQIRLQLGPPTALAEVLARSLERGGEPRLSDDASEVLGKLRRRAQQAKSAVTTAADRLLKTPSVAGALADRFHTERNGRVVLPVRSDAFSRLGGPATVSGILHGSSGTGQTLYVEPHALVDLGNAQREASVAVRGEERRILTRISKQVGEAADVLRRSLDAQIRLDFLQARLRLCAAVGGIAPNVQLPEERGGLMLPGARHPLMQLAGVEVVANDLIVAPSSALILSGPNAGGKTVALKTTGLLVLMATAGLRLPTRSAADVPLFRAVVTDVGDDQSIAGGLSTFSAHVGHVLDALDAAANDGPGTLVLLDEVAVGTEPDQGAALAESIIVEFTRRGAQAMVTTHYERLKLLAVADPSRYTNGSVGFDFEGMRPTFVVRIGTPGPSSALVVAKRLGMPSDVLERATGLLDKGRLEVDALLREVESERERLSVQSAALEHAQAALARGERALAAKQSRTEETASERRRKAHEVATASLRELDAEIKRRRKVLRKAGLPGVGSDGVTDPEERQFARDSRGRLIAARPQTEAPPPEARAFEVGQQVRVVKLGAVGELVTIKGAKLTVQLPLARMTLAADELRHVDGRAGTTGDRAGTASATKLRPQPLPSNAGRHFGSDASPVSLRHDNVLDCRGERAEDALTLVEVFLDRAIADDNDVVVLRHGHGTGALRKAIRGHLGHLAHVAKHRGGLTPEGGDGVTVVWIRP